jgi:hypothetical protein
MTMTATEEMEDQGTLITSFTYGTVACIASPERKQMTWVRANQNYIR